MVIPVDIDYSERAALQDTLGKDAVALSDDYTTLTHGAFNLKGSRPVLDRMLPAVQAHAGVPLRAESTFGRMSQQGAVLKSHTDRPGLDWTVTLPLDARSAEWPFIVEGEPFRASMGQGILIDGRHRAHGRGPCPLGPSYWLLLHYQNAATVLPPPFEPVVTRMILSHEIIDRIDAGANQLEFQPGTTGHDDRERVSDVAWLRRGPEWDWLYEIVVPWMTACAPSHYTFDGAGDAIQLTRYREGGFYGWHRDNDGDNRRMVSTSIVLQPSRVGGNLEIGGHVYVDLSRGDGVVFSSHAKHRVTPVGGGRRDSLVLWLSGEATHG